MLRAPTLEDLPALAAFFGELQQYGTGGASEAEVNDWLTSPMFDPTLDFQMAVQHGRIAGWCDIWDQSRTRERFDLDVRAHPHERATYEVLLDWGVDRACERATRGPAVARVLVDSADEVLAGEVRRHGFDLVRHAFRMEIDLGEEPPAPEWPEGISVRTYRPDDARLVFEANCEIFAEDWNFAPLEFEDWQLHIGSSEFDPALWFISEGGGEIAGFSLCRSERRPEAGHVSVLGVRRPWRRRGLGTALLRHSFREFRARGRAKADLGVDAENPTGAVTLYERVGMHVAYRVDTYEKALP